VDAHGRGRRSNYNDVGWRWRCHDQDMHRRRRCDHGMTWNAASIFLRLSRRQIATTPATLFSVRNSWVSVRIDMMLVIFVVVSMILVAIMVGAPR